jgi:transketolase
VFALNTDSNFLAQQALTIRRDIVSMLGKAKSGHTGGSLSVADLITVLFYAEMKHDPSRPDWPERDRFILSKGHAAPALYSVLARTGYFPVEHLNTLRQMGSILQGHPDMTKTPGVEVCTGSLGQGISIACGLAAAGRGQKPGYRVYAILGDGEQNEGQVWEAAMSAAHYKLSNLCALVDWNGLQIDGPSCKIMNLDPLPDKWKAFGWNTLVINGHDPREIMTALGLARQETSRPTVILAKTIKGKGVSFMQNLACWHGVAPNDEQVCQALDELK